MCVCMCVCKFACVQCACTCACLQFRTPRHAYTLSDTHTNQNTTDTTWVAVVGETTIRAFEWAFGEGAMCAYLYMQICIYRCVHICAHMCTYVHICAHMYTYVHNHSCTHMYATVHIHIYKHFHTHVHTGPFYTTRSSIAHRHRIYTRTPPMHTQVPSTLLGLP